MNLPDHPEDHDDHIHSLEAPRASGAVAGSRVGARPEASKDLLKGEERFRLLVSSIKDYAIFLLDPQGHILSWNEGAQRLKGYSEAEILGKHFSIFYPPEDVAARRPQQLLGKAERDGRVEHEGWRVRKDGTRFWADVVITALRDQDGRLVGFGKVTRDLTERRRWMEERIQLEHERAARQAAEEAVRLRDEFLGVAAHELKTPVTSLRLHAQHVERISGRSGGVDAAILRRALAVVNDQSHRLADLINKLLDVSRVANGHLALDRTGTDIASLVADTINRLRFLHPARAFLVTGPTSLTASVDPLRLEQVLTNLLDNAVRYSPDGPIEVTVARPDPGRVRIEVRDHGPGVPEELRDRLFDRFYQTDSRNARAGLGLGLYISRQIVQQHGGELTAEFPADGGSRFRVELPLDPIEARAKG